MMAFWQNLGRRPGSVDELLRQRVVNPASPVTPEMPLPPEPYETDEEVATKVAAKKARRAEYSVKYMARKYGIEMEEMRKWFNLANGPCSICRGLPRDGRRHPIDHCHRSGKIRAPLCNRCNTLVGQLECNRELIPVAFAYIQRFNHRFSDPEATQ
jgi:hypothetical protein